MGKVYGKNASGSTQLIIDGDAIDKRLSTLEANWDSISQQVVECGHEDGWFWQKYPDGTCVMDGKVSVRATGGTAWGNIWYDSSIRGGEDLPFALKSLTVGTVHVVGGNGSFWATQATSGTPTTAPTWYACRATKGTEGINLQAVYHIVGTWK